MTMEGYMENMLCAVLKKAWEVKGQRPLTAAQICVVATDWLADSVSIMFHITVIVRAFKHERH